MVARRALPLLPPIALVAVAGTSLLIAARSPTVAPLGAFPRPLWLLGFSAVLAALSLYRPPTGGVPTPGPGFGAAALPPLLWLAGALPPAWAVALGLALRELFLRLLIRITGARSPAAGLLETLLTGTAVSTLATLGAGVLWAGAARPGNLPSAGVVVGVTVCFLALLLVQRLGLALWHSGGSAVSWRQRSRALLPLLGMSLLPDLAGWLMGLTLLPVVRMVSGAWALLLLAALALPVVEAARLRLRYEDSRRRLAGFDRLGRAGQRMVLQDQELASVVARISRECRTALPVRWFHFRLRGQTGEDLPSWSAGPDGQLYEGEPDPPTHPPARPGFHRRSEWRVLHHSLRASGEEVGQLSLWCDPRELSEDDLRLFENLLPQMAASIQRSLLDREARHDALTGVAARRELERRLEATWQRAVEDGSAVAVILCDLDHFKSINDTWGHAVGDRALQAAVGALESALRRQPHQEDLLARYGGEEFTALLDGTDGRVALRIAERLRRAVEKLDFQEAGVSIPLTLSAGVAAFPDLHVDTAQELLQLADDALYEAKNQGRNRVLLDLGRGRFRDPRGQILEAERTSEPPEVPRIFS